MDSPEILVLPSNNFKLENRLQGALNELRRCVDEKDAPPVGFCAELLEIFDAATQAVFEANMAAEQAKTEQETSERDSMLYIAAIVSAKCNGLAELTEVDMLYGVDLILERAEMPDGGISLRAYKPAEAIELEALTEAWKTRKEQAGILGADGNALPPTTSRQ